MKITEKQNKVVIGYCEKEGKWGVLEETRGFKDYDVVFDDVDVSEVEKRYKQRVREAVLELQGKTKDSHQFLIEELKEKLGL